MQVTTSLPATSEVCAKAIASVAGPMEQFIKTGIYQSPGRLLYRDRRKNASDITEHQGRRVVRALAREMKRPFIEMSEIWVTHEYHRDATGRCHRTDYEEPRFSHTYVSIPRRKYTTPLATPLLLASPGKILRRAGQKPGDEAATSQIYFPTLYAFRINDLGFWREYQKCLDRPEMRAARRMEPLPPFEVESENQNG